MVAVPPVLILTATTDISADAVVRHLAHRGTPILRFNTDEYPFHSSITTTHHDRAETLSLRTSQGRLLDSVPQAIWYRRVRSPPQLEGMEQPIYDFCLRESRALIEGIALGTSTRIMSHPGRLWAAEHKVYQLNAARACGLPIPRTTITNDPATVREAFTAFQGNMIIKPLKLGYVDDPAGGRAIYTSRVLEEHLDSVADAQLAPAIYQELIPKECDIRVTIVDTTVFTAEIWSQEDPAAAVDWRHTTNPELRHTAGSLPAAIRANLLRLMEHLGLAFGAIDLIRQPDGTYTFLEINPNGQWLWLDDRLGWNISETIAAWLAA